MLLPLARRVFMGVSNRGPNWANFSGSVRALVKPHPRNNMRYAVKDINNRELQPIFKNLGIKEARE